MPMGKRIEFEFRGLRLVALGVEYKRGRRPDELGEVNWDMLYIASDAGKNNLDPLLGFTVQDAIADQLASIMENSLGESA